MEGGKPALIGTALFSVFKREFADVFPGTCTSHGLMVCLYCRTGGFLVLLKKRGEKKGRKKKKKGHEGQAKEEAESCQGVERVEGGLTHLFLLDEEGLRRYRVGACGHMSQPRGSRVVLLHASWRVVGVESQRRERTQLYTAEDTLTVFFA
jgi:hypothetical protein